MEQNDVAGIQWVGRKVRRDVGDALARVVLRIGVPQHDRLALEVNLSHLNDSEATAEERQSADEGLRNSFFFEQTAKAARSGH